MTGQDLERLVRDVGRRWGARLKAQHLAMGRPIRNWPGTLDEARRLVDSAAGDVNHEGRELLALLVERGARRAWHSSDLAIAPEETLDDRLEPHEHESAPAFSRTPSGVMLKPSEVVTADPAARAAKAG